LVAFLFQVCKFANNKINRFQQESIGLAVENTGMDDHPGWIKTNQGVGACIAAVVIALLIYLATSDWAFEILRDGFRLGFFTAFATLTMLICAVAIMFDRHRMVVEEDIAPVVWRDWVIAVGILSVCYIYFELAWRIDFLLVSPLFIAGGTFALGVRPLRTAFFAGIAITVVIYILFRLIGIELPTRLIWF
jgi:hypothetical protein